MATAIKHVEAQFSYSYLDSDGSNVSFEEGDRFILINKSTEDWWKVERIEIPGDSRKKVVYVPATYMKEVTAIHSQVTRSNSTSESNPEYMNLDTFRETMIRTNSNTDSDYSYSDQDTASSLGTSPRALNGSLSPGGMMSLSDRKSMNLEAVLGEMASRQVLHKYDAPIPDDIIRLKKSSESMKKPTESMKKPKEIPVKLREKKDTDGLINRRSSTLPAGWQKVTDDNSGRQFYYNEVTKESVWKPPRMSALIDDKEGIASKEVPATFQEAPAGWTVEKDESNQDIYVNSSNQEKWKACQTENGKTYYYKIGEDITVWELPEVEVRFRGIRRRSLDDLSDDKLGNRMSSTFPRNSKCKSVLFDFASPGMKKEKEFAKPKTVISPKILHRRSQSASTLLEAADETPTIRLPNGKVTMVPDVEGCLTRKKLVEGGKSKKFHWEQVYVCKYENILVFYKDKKSATPKPDFPSGKPDSSIDLRGACLEPPNSDKTKGRKNVFQLSTYNHGTVLMLMAENPIIMATWLTPIHSTIKQLEEANPLPPGRPMGCTDSVIDVSDNLNNTLQVGAKYGVPQSPISPTFPRKEKGGVDRAERTLKGISRRLSKRTSSLADDDVSKTRKRDIKDKIMKFLPKRPTYYELEKKGIIKQEIFGCHLQKLCQREGTIVPKFVVKCVETVEKRGLTVRGIYRECGNASQMHKLRILTDQGEHVDFDDKLWADVHMIAGALKWYFRELPDPLIPAAVFDDFVNGIKNPSIHERRRIFGTLVANLPKVNFDTLKYLLEHLQKVTQHSSENKMETNNCSIVFGPTLLRPLEVEDNHLNIAMNAVYQNQIINFLLTEYSEVFGAG